MEAVRPKKDKKKYKNKKKEPDLCEQNDQPEPLLDSAKSDQSATASHQKVEFPSQVALLDDECDEEKKPLLRNNVENIVNGPSAINLQPVPDVKVEFTIPVTVVDNVCDKEFSRESNVQNVASEVPVLKIDIAHHDESSSEINRRIENSIASESNKVLNSLPVTISKEYAGQKQEMEEQTVKLIEVSCPPSTEMPLLVATSEPLYPRKELDQLKDQSKKHVSHLIKQKPIEAVEEDLDIIRPFLPEQLMALYQNNELTENINFVDYFVQHEKEPQNNEFYELLKCYLRSRLNLISSEKEMSDKKAEVQKHMSQVWQMIPKTISNKLPCSDGVTVTGVHKFVQAQLNQGIIPLLSQALQELKHHAQVTYVIHAYTCEVVRLQIDSFIYGLLNMPCFKNIPRNAPVIALQHNEVVSDQWKETALLRGCISDLFSFQRKLIKDKQFVDDTRQWLTKLIAVLLRCSTTNEHLFILNHVLRCPAGSGHWGALFIQPPSPQLWSPGAALRPTFGSHLLNHTVTVLATILLPIRARDEFLASMRSTQSLMQSVQSSKENYWVVVDSEGEEDEDPETVFLQWQENDIVAFLNQVPISDLFRHILLVERRDVSDTYDVTKSDEQNMLKLLAFSSHLILLFYEGLKTFNSLRFRQLTKRLSRLIRHSVQYVSDHWECFLKFHRSDLDSHERALVLRLQIEYDQFFLRAVNCIFSSQKLGSWQFMAVLPYTCVSIQMMWRLLWLLHNNHTEEQEVLSYKEANWKNRVTDRSIKAQLEESLESMAESEAYYLLTAFSNMAISRGAADIDFVYNVSLEIFEVAFLNSRLRELLSREGRDLLASIALKHPSIISVLLSTVVEAIDHLGMMCLFLFRELPLHLWQPTSEDFEILTRCLLDNPLVTPFNQLARLIITGLNWGFTSDSTSLFLSLEFHHKTAMLITSACDRLASPDGSFIYRSMQQVLWLASSVRQSTTTATTKQGFAAWTWDMLISLRLHALDQPCIPWTSVLSGKVTEYLAIEGKTPINVPNFHQSDWLHCLERSAEENSPTSLYAVLMLTDFGHDIDRIVNEGLSLWFVLVSKEVYSAASRTLFYLMPFFYSYPERLLNNEKFITDLQLVILADVTYTAVAKSLVVQEFPGKGLKYFTSTMLCQVNEATKYSQEVGGQAMKLYLKLLIKLLSLGPRGLLAKWKGADQVYYLLEQLVCNAVGDPYLMDTMAETLLRLVKECPTSSGGNVVSSILSMVWSSSGQDWPSLIPVNTLPNFPWFFWAALGVEMHHPQMDKFWNSVLKELSCDFRSSPETALKKVSSHFKVPAFRLESLPIYRWAQQALETSIEHPCLPLLWQNFFLLYLQRTEAEPRNQNRGSVGFKFFEGDFHLAFHKKLKRRLQETVDHFNKQMTESRADLSHLQSRDPEDTSEDEVDVEKLFLRIQAKIDCLTKMMQIFKTYTLWLEEPRLHDATVNLSAFPPQYNASKLQLILDGDMKPWLDLVDLPAHQKELDNLQLLWHQQRKVLIVSPKYGLKEEKSPSERILKRLCTYDDPLAPPPLQPVLPIIPEINSSLLQSGNMFFESAQSGCRTLCEQARTYSNRLSKHVALDEEYLGLLPGLYINVDAQEIMHVFCVERKSPNDEGCSGPATINLKFKEARLLGRVKDNVDINRNTHALLLKEVAQAPPQNVCCAAVYIESCISSLVKWYRLASDSSDVNKTRLREIGLALFHHMLELVGENSDCYPPSRQFLSSSIEVLGQEFVYGQEDQCFFLAHAVISRPWLSGIIAPLFSPTSVSPQNYVQLYEFLVSKLTLSLASTIFVLISKFDLGTWLSTSRSGIFERESLVEAIGKAMAVIGQNPHEDFLIALDVFRRHLQFLLMHQFPQLYGSNLQLLLKGSTEGWLTLTIWYDFMGCLGAPKIPKSFGQPSEAKAFMEAFGEGHTLLTQKQLEETLQTLALFMNHERNTGDGQKYGLFHKLNFYLTPMATFIGLITHAWIMSTLCQLPSKYSETVVQKLWDRVKDTFNPWVSPNLTQTQINMPWQKRDSKDATFTFNVFAFCLSFLQNGLSVFPENNLLSCIWEFEVKNFCNAQVEKHVRSVSFASLSLLNWENFYPSCQDLALMTKVLEKSLDDCNAFLGVVFLSVPWPLLFEQLAESQPLQLSVEMASIFSMLAVQLAWEPSVKQSGGMIKLLQSMERIGPWHLLEAQDLEKLILSAAKSANPIAAVVQNIVEPETHVFIFLLHLAGLSPPPSYTTSEIVPKWPIPTNQPTWNKKRLLYIRSYVHLVAKAASSQNSPKHNILQRHKVGFESVVPKLMDLCEAAVTTDPPENQFENLIVLLVECLGLLGTFSPAPLQEIVLTSLNIWLTTNPSSILILPCLMASCRTLPYVRHLVTLAETCISAFFSAVVDRNTPFGSWSHVIPALDIPASRQDEFLNSCAETGAHLCLNAFLFRVLPSCRGLAEEMGFLQKAVDWACSIKPKESNEAKILLIWDKVLDLSIRQLDYRGDERATQRVLNNFCATLLTFGEDKVSVGLLGAVGLGRRSPHSLRMRFMCRSVATFILLQLPTNGPVRLESNAPGHMRSTQEGRGKPSQQALNAIGKLESLKTNKQYMELRTAIEFVWNFSMDPRYSLRDGQSLISELSKIFFSNTAFLCTLNLRHNQGP